MLYKECVLCWVFVFYQAAPQGRTLAPGQRHNLLLIIICGQDHGCPREEASQRESGVKRESNGEERGRRRREDLTDEHRTTHTFMILLQYSIDCFMSLRDTIA